MRRVKIQWLLAIAATGLGAAVVLADPGNLPPPGSTSVFSQMLGRNVPPTQASKDSDAKSNKKADKKPTRPPEDPIAKARDQELANWLRRQEICVKLMQIAESTNDEALLRKAQELDQRSADAYHRRLAELNEMKVDEENLNKQADAKKKNQSGGLFSFFRSGDRASSTAKEGTPQ
jgi:hypothetical protein